MQSVAEQFRGNREVPVREYRQLREGPGLEFPEVDMPVVGWVAETEVWAEFQVGISETTWELIAAVGCMVEDSATAGLRKGDFQLVPEQEQEPPDPGPTGQSTETIEP